ncbi:polyprenyl synthetase family protein [Streptomyces sp. DT2A-34]|uniref:polyprenyl synthetase family protein n=1 Tax=Streptomyces sp. DT2A-34 TaxID=3051182 RepID=UPI00265BF797|nr:polyprenyl synthetase family protein [Streptomyces sp. DT2A-34]MDO0910975.1 polyprenyl synthetase family protein [Streptomyces sp. DT2A-34]
MIGTAAGTNQIRVRIAGYEQRVGTLVQEYFDGLSANLSAPSFSKFTPECLSLLRDLSLRGGKRMRAVLLFEAARLVSTELVEGLDAAALSIELLQTHGLVHDDIIDDSPTRRGGPSTYYAYRAKFPDQPQTALGLALLAGDLALALSQQVLLDSSAPLPARQAMIEAHTRATADTFIGQITDIERDFTPTADDELLHSVAEYKSARYSILAPMQLGLLAAGEQTAPFDEELRRYARQTGICGQMRDDYLDLFGEAETMGKPTGTDIRDGRRNYVVQAILAAATGAERALVESALGNPACPPQTITAVREIGQNCGAEQKLRADMQHHAEVASAEAAAWRPRWREEAVAFFEYLPLWNVERAL